MTAAGLFSCTFRTMPSYRFTSPFAPCVQQTPPLINPSVHPSKLHRFLFAPFVTQTPPSGLDWYILQSCIVFPPSHLAFAPCVQQTPPFWTKLVHPFKLQRFLTLIAPCVTQIPPLTTWLVHPLKLHRLTSLLAPCV